VRLFTPTRRSLLYPILPYSERTRPQSTSTTTTMAGSMPYYSGLFMVATLVLTLLIDRTDSLTQEYCSTENTGASNGACMNDTPHFSEITFADSLTAYWTWQSNGWCSTHCQDDYAFAIVQGNNCWCSNYIPADQSSVSDCSDKCPGFPAESCGSLNNDLFGYVALSKSPSGTMGAASSTSSTVSSPTTSSLSVPSSTFSSLPTTSAAFSSSRSSETTVGLPSSSFSISPTSTLLSSATRTSLSSRHKSKSTFGLSTQSSLLIIHSTSLVIISSAVLSTYISLVCSYSSPTPSICIFLTFSAESIGSANFFSFSYCEADR